MKILLTLFLMCSFVAGAAAAESAAVYEYRVYYVHPGKMPDMLKRFRDHTCKLFEKHGMVNVGYWLPVDETKNELHYVLEHKSRDAAKASWKSFGEDPEWKQVRDASEANGKIVAKVESTFLAATDYSADPTKLGQLRTGARVYELRIYLTNEGKLPNLDTRFRDHTLKLFEKHGMTNVLYTHPVDADKGAGKTLVYWLAHDSVDAAKKSFDTFRNDPEWIKVRDASEAGGKILANPPTSLFLKPVDFSALK